ncbi:MAG: hypothetical protein HY717_22085 [Planctomycetes bacterium]|nr:hypothetical protein [Planctomycetota bacterium]
MEKDSGSSGSLRLVPGIVAGQAVEFDWDLGTGDWVQARFTFPRPVDLSRADLFGLTLQGGGPGEPSNTVGILLADANDVFHGYDVAGKSRGINRIDRPLVNLPVPKKLLRFFFAFGTATEIDWSRIDRFFLVVKRPGPGAGGGSGRLRLDHVQHDAAAQWPRQARFEAIAPREEAARRAALYILAQQKPTGLVVSWKEESSPKAWLYDQGLALLVLSREGIWSAGAPANEPARAAKKLADFLAARQKGDGHWPRARSHGLALLRGPGAALPHADLDPAGRRQRRRGAGHRRPRGNPDPPLRGRPDRERLRGGGRRCGRERRG